jgi:hypothetical protein
MDLARDLRTIKILMTTRRTTLMEEQVIVRTPENATLNFRTNSNQLKGMATILGLNHTELRPVVGAVTMFGL